MASSPQAPRSWLQEVCSGSLRWKGRLDLAIDSVALKKKPTGWLRKVLLIAAYQLIVQERTQPGMVVSETVSEVKRKEGEAPSRFANALLRKLADHASEWRELKLRPQSSTQEAAAWASLPEWLWKKLVKERGPEWAQAYARASLDRPVLWVRTRDLQWKPEWAEPGPVPGSLRATEGGALTGKSGFEEGRFFVQDISSQALVHEIVEEVRRVLGSGDLSALDLCAAPGGKSLGLAWDGLKVSSSDRDEKRLALVRQNMERLATPIAVIPKDKLRELPEQDLVWVDAPCTGTGILRRHPDVRWLRKEQELEGLLKVQQEVIREAWEKIRPGGFLAYSVCSVLRDEGPGALEKAKLPPKTREWFLEPQSGAHGDGFYAALIRKS